MTSPPALLHLQVSPGPDGQRTIKVAAGQTLLAAAESAGIPLRGSCRAGSCRACMSRLAFGQVRYRVEWPGLLAEEKAAGWILPCVAEAASAELGLAQWPLA